MEKPLQLRDTPIENMKTSHDLVKKYDLVFVGGGPSTLAFICSLLTNKIIEKIIPTCNILIIEKHDNFGSGCLGKYGINTNTSAEGFPRLICFSEEDKKDKSGKLALSPTKNRIKQSKNELNVGNKENSHENMDIILNVVSIKNGTSSLKNKENKSKEKITLKRNPLFNEIFCSSAVQSLLEIGDRPAPLGLVGNFLETLGNFIIHHISTNYGKNILMNRSEVTYIKIGKDEEFKLYLKQNEINKNSHFPIEIRAKCLVLSTGGNQNVKCFLYNKIVNMKGEENVFISDYVLGEMGYVLITNRIKKFQENVSNRKIIVTIIGGSHSGFSSAWILLNKPSIYINIKAGSDYIPKQISNCQRCKINNNTNNKTGKSINENGFKSNSKSNFTSNYKSVNNSSLLQECYCYGKINESNWLTYLSSQNNIKNIEIQINILYRDNIKVYYSSREEAAKDNYTEFDETSINKNGKIYPFLGIRGDAKELYRKIKKGEERRVKLIKTSTDEMQLDHIKKSDLVIWACGYETNDIPLFDSKNNPIELLTDHNGTVEVDKKLNIMLKNKAPIKNLYGIGQGYSTKAPEIINGKKQRADSIHLYNTYIAKKLYKSLEPFLDKLSLDSTSSNKSINNYDSHNVNNQNLSTNIHVNSTNNNSKINLNDSLKRKSSVVNPNVNENRNNIENSIKKNKSTLVITGKYVVNNTPIRKIDEIRKDNLENFLVNDNKKIWLADNKKESSMSNDIKIQNEKILKERNMNNAYFKSWINPIFLNDHLLTKSKKLFNNPNVESKNTISITNHILKNHPNIKEISINKKIV